jgi:hypothetical protein
MSDLDVRIVEMEPIRVASALGFGETPELLAWNKILAYAKAKGLDTAAARFFGFNNPDPSPGSPNYGYEQWMTVGPGVEGEGEVTIKEIPARRYAVAHCEGLSTIGQVRGQPLQKAAPFSRVPGGTAHAARCPVRGVCFRPLSTHRRVRGSDCLSTSGNRHVRSPPPRTQTSLGAFAVG